MKHLILTREIGKDEDIQISGKDYHYLVNVRRLAVGENFPALLPGGEKILIQVVSINNGILTGKRFIDPADLPSECLYENDFQIILFQALPKADKMDLIVRQAAEGGIAQIVPFAAEFSAGSGKVGEQKFSRWEKIIKEARQQSGSRTATVIRQPLLLKDLIEHWKNFQNSGAVGILFHHEKGLEMNSLHGYLNNNPKSIVLAVGPEGGFSEKEVSIFLENGFKPLTIGDTILRTETAALYCAAAVRILLLEKNSWQLKQI